tara:strand:- start:1070 stop:1507 length:438 start_codon:yes stop_codon:yes gene_type:complete
MAVSAYTDAQLNNNISRNVKQYSDLDLFFSKKIVDKDVNKVTDIQAVKRSIRNLVLLNTYEKPFHPEISSGVRNILFETISPLVANLLTKRIEDVIENFEPRAKLISVLSIPDLDRNSYEVAISFYVVNAPTELVNLSLMLERLR